MSAILTGGYFFVKQPQFVEEATFGITPSSSTFVNCGGMADMSSTVSITENKYRQLGSRDIYKDISTGEVYGISFKYNPFNSIFLKYGTEYWNAAATGNIAKSLSILWSQNINGVENFYLAQGCRTDRIDIDVTEAAVAVSHTLVAKNMTTPTTTTPVSGTPVYAGANSGLPWVGPSGGSSPLTINSINYDVERFRLSVSQNLDKVKPNGETQIKFLEATNRDVMVDIDMIVENTTTLADVKTLTARTASYVLNSATSTTVNLTNLYLAKYTSSDSPTQNKVKRASFSGIAQSVTITN